MADQTDSNIPNGRKVYLDSDGNPLAGGTVTWYVPGTQSLAPIYKDLNKTLQANPVELDGDGTCVAFGTGVFQEIVRDAEGDLISDRLVVAGGTATPTVPPTPTPTTFTHLSIFPADESLGYAPTANPPATLSSLNVQGTTVGGKQREFLFSAGLTSNADFGQISPSGVNCDKVAGYFGLVALPNSADVWTINTCLTLEAGSGAINAQGIELDFNNHEANRGASGNILQDFTAPIRVGYSATGDATFTGSTSFTNTAAFMGFGGGGNNAQWARQFVASGKTTICAFQDWTANAPVGIQFDAQHSVADINFTSVYGNAGSISATALFLKNNQNLSWQNNNATNAVTDTVDTGNNRLVGVGSPGVFIGASTALAPLTPGISLGLATSRWGDVFADNVRLPNGTVLSWENASDTGFIFDYADNGNNRIVGGGANTVYIGSTSGIAPVNSGQGSCGSAGNPWNLLYTVNGTVGPSDVRLKRDITPLADVADKIEQIEPISFKWINDQYGTKTHMGFDADNLHSVFGDDAAIFQYDADTDRKQVAKDEVIALLVSYVKKLNDRVKALESK